MKHGHCVQGFLCEREKSYIKSAYSDLVSNNNILGSIFHKSVEIVILVQD